MKALNPNPLKMKSKGVTSVESRVTNIKEHLTKEVSIGDFKKILKDNIIKLYKDIEEYELTKEDIKAIQKLRDEKYST
jgi:lipoate-protein ligase A